eukprot:CAMPEP_0195517022 /NCGR_PEP_ID=MMETSP0794_2-20130614/9514_1 /TAXON_ID=515487 /ORGANISM="Stephanopyxis turris, Strain CCMP 815" /LENGTH=536 /DNA_ID=CAMNT_0040645753 /DNA_START=62 /DNA_END=1672 /DNA_ORIENTATION=-
MAPLRLLLCSLLVAKAIGEDIVEGIVDDDAIGPNLPDKVSSRLNIHIPQSLFKDEGYKHREALFGIPPYGGSIAQELFYADSNLCDQEIDVHKGYPEREKDSKGKMEPWPSPFILMVDRGDCTFVQKARNAQRVGAAGVIIADHLCLCSDGKECTSSSPVQECQQSEPVMGDDGSGGDVSIPTFLMFKMDADEVKANLRQNIHVQMEMSWNLPRPDDRVEYDLWTVPSDEVSKEFQKSFKPAATALGSHAYFTPHMYIHDGVKALCRDRNGDEVCGSLCTNQGRYCSTDPDGDLEKGISGSDVTKESLRRLCIWNHYGKDDGIGEKWWDYVKEFYYRCDTPSFFMSQDCIKDVYDHAGIDGTIVETCMQDSGGTDNDKENNILEEEMNAATKMGVVIMPTAFVNESAIRGKLSVNTIFAAVCAGFEAGSVPDICKQCASCPDQQGCISNGQCSNSNDEDKLVPAKGSISKGTFLVTIFGICGAFAAVFYWHKQRTQQEMRNEVKGILAQYMPLESEDGEIGAASDFAQRAGTTEIS